MTVRAPVQGRLLSDFQPGATFEHPWDVTVDAGAVAAFQAALLDAAPTYASGPWARALGFRDRPVHPLQLLVYACSFAQQDTSELAVAELGLEDVRFPSACYPGESLRAWSRVTDVGEASHDRGVVSLRTTLETDGHAVCAVTRKLLVPVGHNERRPRSPWSSSGREITELPRLPESLRDRVVLPDRRFGFAAFFEDFPAGDTILHPASMNVDLGCTTQLARLARATQIPAALSALFTVSLAAREIAGNALWDMGLDDVAFGPPLASGDVLHAVTRIVDAHDHDERTGIVTFRTVAVRGVEPKDLLDRGIDPFEQEIPERVCVLSRTLLLRKRPGRISIG